jgi:hypothetical protein
MNTNPRARLLVAAAAITLHVAAAPAAPFRVLFIGNSLTYTNDLPAMVARLGHGVNDPIRVGMVAKPNLAIIDHVNGSSDAVSQIEGSRWTFVVLQQGPTSFPGVCRDTLILATMRLAPSIRKAGARAAILLPWTAQDHPERLAGASESAVLAARAVGGVVVPVGAAWRDALRDDPTMPLYGPDGYHPAPAGTLLAALTVYERLFGRDVTSRSIESVAEASKVQLSPGQLRALAVAAHGASAGFPADSPTPLPADTTVGSSGGGPC